MEVCLTGSDQVKLHPWGWGDGVDEVKTLALENTLCLNH